MTDSGGKLDRQHMNLYFVGRLLFAHRFIHQVDRDAALHPVLQEMRATMSIVRSLSTAGTAQCQSRKEAEGDSVSSYITGTGLATPDEQAEVEQWVRRLNTNQFELDDGHRVTGVSLSAVISLVNHACEPNSILITQGRMVLLCAFRDVVAGEEWTITYIGEDKLVAPVSTRRKFLRDVYRFGCQCRRCVSEAS